MCKVTTRSIEFSTDDIIIVVEDDLVNQIIMKSLLEQKGLALQIANNGQEGVDTVQNLIKDNQFPDLILMDINMPIMDGYESTKKIREHLKNTHVPIFIVSSNADDDSYKKAMDSGADGYITKPVRLSELTKVFEKFLRKKEISDSK